MHIYVYIYSIFCKIFHSKFYFNRQFIEASEMQAEYINLFLFSSRNKIKGRKEGREEGRKREGGKRGRKKGRKKEKEGRGNSDILFLFLMHTCPMISVLLEVRLPKPRTTGQADGSLGRDWSPQRPSLNCSH